MIEIAYNLFHAIDLHRLAGDADGGPGRACSRGRRSSYGLLAGLWTKERRVRGAGPPARPLDEASELERRVEQLDAVRFLVKGDVLTLRAAAVRFVLANHLVSSAVLGPHTVEQLEQLVRETGSGPDVPRRRATSPRLPRALSRVGITHVRGPTRTRRSRSGRAAPRRPRDRAAGQHRRDRTRLRGPVRRRVQGEGRSGHARRPRGQRAHLRRARAPTFPGMPIVAEESDPATLRRLRGEPPRLVRRPARRDARVRARATASSR